MRVIEHTHNGSIVAEVTDLTERIADAGAALDVIASAQYSSGTNRIVLHCDALDESFFDLSSGLAGEILQKVSNYGLQLAIVGDFSQVTGGALLDFIRESNEYGQVMFLPDVQAAVERMGSVGRSRT